MKVWKGAKPLPFYQRSGERRAPVDLALEAYPASSVQQLLGKELEPVAQEIRVSTRLGLVEQVE